MPVTSPDNIWTPDSGDDYALTVDLARMADDIQDALNIRPPVEDTGFVPLTTFGTGWSGTSGYAPWIRRVGNRVDIGGAVTRTTTLGALATIVQIPEGFRITHATYRAKFMTAVNASTGQVVTMFYNSAVSHYLQLDNTYITNSPLGSGAAIPLSGTWYIDN